MLKICSLLLCQDLLRNRLVKVRRRSRSCAGRSVELLEERALLTTFTVSDVGDSGENTLRQAILDANANPGADSIVFDIGNGTQTIQPLTGLPTITDPVSIDGTTQPGYNGTPLIVLNGALIPDETFVDGLTINTTDSLIKGLVINGFESAGIVIGGFGSSGVSGIHVEGNYIGVDVTGTTAVPNSNGIRISDGATLNVIGGVGAAGNVISGNTSFGIALGDAGTVQNRIVGNAIGTSADKSNGVGNGYGIGVFSGASSNEIGGLIAGEGNLISGNVNNGVLMEGAETSQNKIVGNRIGTNASGTAALGAFTTSSGIAISDGAHDNTIGGNTPAARNQIAGVHASGIAIADATSTNNQIQGNYIGVSADGATAIANGGDGILLNNAHLTVIGGNSPDFGNVISGSSGNGITIFGEAATLNVIRSNRIGTDATGSIAIPNSGDGIRVDGAGQNSIGSTAATGNVISGNSGNGIRFANVHADSNTVIGNLIGVAADGTTALGNTADGIRIELGATNNQIGGNAAAQWNTIANNVKGISVVDSTSIGNTILGNRIFANVSLAIDLNRDNVTPNDPLDADNGPNSLQNFPVLISVHTQNGTVEFTGSLDAKPNSTYTLAFYSSTTNDANGNGQGALPLGTVDVFTDANGHIDFSETLNVVVPTGHLVTATATDLAEGSTSEFSASVAATSITLNSPIVTLPGGALNYHIGKTPVVVDAAASVTDPDSTNFNTGHLTVSLNSTGEKGEKVKIRKQGTGANQITTKGTKVLFGGVVIGKANSAGGASKSKSLVVTFNSSATPAAVSHLLQNMTYVNSNKKSALQTRTLLFQVTDEAGHLSNLATKVIHILHAEH